MTWRDDLLRVTLPDGRQLIGASFRGVSFFVDESSRSGGRRIVTHEFPMRDDPAIEDLGRAARAFPMEAYLVGDEYHVQLRALLSALEDVSGPGELVHPYHGVRRAICSALSVRETKSDGGMATLSLEFAEAPEAAPTPTEVRDAVAEVEASAGAAMEAVTFDLEQSLDTDGLPNSAFETLAADLTAIATTLQAGFARIATTPQQVAAMNVEIQSITSQASSLVRAPAELADSLAAVTEALADTVLAAPREFMRAVLDAYDVEQPEPAAGVSGSKERERANQEAFGAGVRRMLVVDAARVLPTIEHDTLDDALADRDDVAARLEEQAATATDAAYPALVQLRADVMRAVPGERVLDRVVTLEQRSAIPSLLLSYRVYGGVRAWEDRVIARNRPAHPAFMAGTLKVLARG